MKIGISTIVKSKNEQWEQIKELIGFGFRYIEISNKYSRVQLRHVDLLKEFSDKVDLSLHSLAGDICGIDKIVSSGSTGYLKSEIRIAGLSRIGSVNFHIDKKGKLTASDFTALSGLIGFAKKQGVDLSLEGNYRDIYAGDYLVEILEKLPGLKFCLDIGHLNLAIKFGYINDRDDFLEKVRDRIIKMHVQFNDGLADRHRGLGVSGKKFLCEVLEILGRKDFLFIIEMLNLKDAVMAKNFLEKL